MPPKVREAISIVEGGGWENIRHIIQFRLFGTAADGCYIPEPEAWAEIVEVPLPVPVEGIPDQRQLVLPVATTIFAGHMW